MLRSFSVLAAGVLSLPFAVHAASFPSRLLYPPFTESMAKTVISKFKFSKVATVATDINDSGVIVGFTSRDQRSEGFIRAQNGSVTFFKVSVGGLSNAFINNRGAVAGTYEDDENGNFRTHGYVRNTAGTVKQFDFPQSAEGHVAAINSSGYVLGQYGSHGVAAFVRAPDGKMTTFQTGGNHTIPNGTSTTATSMNDSGIITGSCNSKDLRQVIGFVRGTDGTIVKFHVPSFETDPLSINASGEIAGVYYDHNDNEQGFLRSPNGSILRFGYPAALQTSPIVVNDMGDIVGKYQDSTGKYHDFVRYSDGTFSSFDISKSLSNGPAAINASGVITGYVVNEASLEEGFVRTP